MYNLKRRSGAKAKPIAPTPEMNELLRQSGDFGDLHRAEAANVELAKALSETMPIRQGVMDGDNVSWIFQDIPLEAGAYPEFPLDLVVPGTERDHVAYAVPAVGRIPERHVEGDYVTIKTYETASSIDWAMKFARDARWDVVGRAMQVLEASFVLKRNRDGWRLLISGGKDRNLAVYDDLATAGLFTKRLISLAKTTMRRKAGGNASSVNRGEMTDICMSPEAVEDIRSWTITEVDDLTRYEIFNAPGDESALPSIFGVNLRIIDELGVGQEYQKYFIDTLGGTLPGSKVELAVALDLRNQDSFVHPIRERMKVYDDPTFLRQRRAGKVAWEEGGWGLLDGRRVMLLAL